MSHKSHTIFTISFLLSSTLYPAVHSLYEFQSLAQSPYYIDKSYFLSTLFFDLKTPHNFLTCPRRFGKTTMLLMIENFAQIEIDKHRQPIPWSDSKAFKLFGNLNAAEIRPLMGNHLARYPVIELNLGFQTIEDFNGTDLLVHLNQRLAKSFEKFRWLCKSRYSGNYTHKLSFTPCYNISQDEYTFLRRALNKSLDYTEILNSLYDLCRLLYDYFRGTPIIVLVDDYDSAAINAMLVDSVNLTEYYDLVDAMLSRVFVNGHKYIKFSLVTATTAINFYKDQPARFATVVHRPFLSSNQFTPFCGFLKTEIDAAFHKYHLNRRDRSDVTAYYNGYLTSSQNDPKLIYNPFGFTRYLMFERQLKKYSLPTLQFDIIFKSLAFTEFRQNLFKTAWSKTTHKCNFTLKKTYEQDDLEKMMYLLKKPRNYLTQEQISEDKESYIRILHSFAFEQGYFTYSYKEKNNFKIPNYQIKLEIKEMMKKYYEKPPNQEF